ncbi:MAG: hypothetical protein LUF92_15235 [Clostridiales bacterium]|nr:hypothetical protein [Clostridiales bacterium]
MFVTYADKVITEDHDRTKKYFLVVCDDNTSMEVLRQEIVVDIAFADDFGFGF